MRDKIYYDGELADYDDIERIENLYYTSKPVDIDDVSLDSEYDYRRLPKFIQEDIDYAESANDLISKGNFLDADDEEFTFNDIMKYEYKGDTYIIRTEGYSYPRYVVKITNVGESFAKGGNIKDFEKGKFLQGKQWSIYKSDTGWQLERYKGDNLVEQYSIEVKDSGEFDEDNEMIDFIDYIPNYDGEILIPENVQIKVIRLLEKVNPKYNFGDEYENQIRVNEYSEMYAKGGDIKTMNMIELESIGTIIDPRTGMTYAMMADGKSYDPDTETHITEIDMSEYDNQITEKDREILLDILQNPEIDEFARGGKLEVGKSYRAKFSNKFNKRVLTDFKVVDKFKGRDNMPMVEIITENGERANVFEKDLKPLMFAKGGMFEHGLRVGDKITSSLPNDSVEVIDEFDNEVEINLNTGQRQDLRFAKGGMTGGFNPSGNVPIIKAKYYGMSDFGELIFKGDNGRFYVVVDGKTHSTTDDLEPMFPVLNVKLLDIPKDTGVSFAKGGRLNSVLVKFKDPQYNYVTSIGANVSEAEAKNYFIGMPVNVASYPSEKFVEVIDIEYNPKSKDMKEFAIGGKISKDEAIVKAMRMGVDFNKQFHAQSYGNELAELARETGYRKSKSSSGSLGRAFFEHLEKRYDKSPEYYDNLSTNDMFAKGGLLEHGLKSGDTIMFPLSDNRVEVKDLFGQSKQVDLDTGERTEMRYAKGGDIIEDLYSRQEEEEKGKTFEKYKVFVFEKKTREGMRVGDYPFAEFETDNILDAMEFGINKMKTQRGYRDDTDDMYVSIEQFVPIRERKGNPIYAYENLLSFDEQELKRVSPFPFEKGGMTGKKTYLLDSYFVDVYEDSYEQGELDMVHSWSSRDMQDANKEFPNKEALLNYLKDIIESQVTGQYEIKDDFFDIDDMGEGEVRINTSVMAKYDNRGYGEYIYPTQEEKDMWKKGEQKLFSVNYVFSVEVYNKTNLSF